eukprot:s39_g17.t1
MLDLKRANRRKDCGAVRLVSNLRIGFSSSCVKPLFAVDTPVKVLQSWYFQMWEWQDATWHRLNSKDAKILEKAYLQDPSGCWPLTLGPHESCYQVDFFAMKQRSRNGRVRNLRRKEIPEIQVEAPEVVEAPAEAIPDVVPSDMEPLAQAVQEIPIPVPELLLPPAQDWSPPLNEAMEASLGRAEALVEACQALEEVVQEMPEAWQVPSDFGSLQSLQRSVALGRVVLVKGSWLALAFEPFSLGVADLPTRHTLPPEAIWTQMDSLDEATAAQRLVVLSADCAQESAASLSQQLGRANRLLSEGNAAKEERGVFLDCCSLYLDQSEGEISQCWRDTSEWLASPFTTKWLLSDAGSSGPRCWERHLAALRRSSHGGVFQVEFNTELMPLLTTPQVTPDALDSLLQEKSFRRPEDLEIAKALYREAFHRMVRSQEVMDCSNLDWDDFHMLQLAEVLIHCKSLVKLILAENRAGDFGFEALASRLPDTLEILDFSGNRFGDEGLRHLARHLPPRLRQLCLSSNHFGEPGMEALVKTLPDCSQLSSLSLARVPLAGASLSQLVALKALRHLCLNEAHLGCEGVLHLTLPTSLEELLLDGNSLGDAGLRMLTPKLPGSLQLLSLSDNGLRDAGLRALAPSTRSLRTLRVNSNHFTTQALQELGLSSPETKILAMHQRP